MGMWVVLCGLAARLNKGGCENGVESTWGSDWLVEQHNTLWHCQLLSKGAVHAMQFWMHGNGITGAVSCLQVPHGR